MDTETLAYIFARKKFLVLMVNAEHYIPFCGDTLKLETRSLWLWVWIINQNNELDISLRSVYNPITFSVDMRRKSYKLLYSSFIHPSRVKVVKSRNSQWIVITISGWVASAYQGSYIQLFKLTTHLVLINKATVDVCCMWDIRIITVQSEPQYTQ